jgi:multimeric flavodoxin WrbA
MKVLGISTSSNTGFNHKSWGSSGAVLRFALDKIAEKGHKTKLIDAAKLHIVGNLSCYSSGAQGCADPSAGKYRCWAWYNSVKDPEKYGGIDEMPIIYDNIAWADVVIFSTSVRWGSHTAIMQNVIERMNTLENRHTVYKEKNPLSGKKLGIIVTGQHWLSQRVAEQALDALGQMGFDAGRLSMFTWQRSNDMRLEQVGPNRPIVEEYLMNPFGKEQMRTFLQEIGI